MLGLFLYKYGCIEHAPQSHIGVGKGTWGGKDRHHWEIGAENMFPPPHFLFASDINA